MKANLNEFQNASTNTYKINSTLYICVLFYFINMKFTFITDDKRNKCRNKITHYNTMDIMRILI